MTSTGQRNKEEGAKWVEDIENAVGKNSSELFVPLAECETDYGANNTEVEHYATGVAEILQQRLVIVSKRKHRENPH